MRVVLLSASIIVAASASFSGAVWAQSAPSPDSIVRSLTPTTTLGPTRGIRIVTPPNGAPAGTPKRAPAAALPSASLSVLFATGSAELTPSAIKTLDALGKALTDPRIANNKFRIEGHTDTVGTADSNKALSEARAKAVASYLASAYHVDPGKLEAVGMGEEGLLVQTPDQTPDARNRRVVVVNLGG